MTLSRSWQRGFAVALAMCLVAIPGMAQRWQLDAGGSVVRGDSATRLAAASLAPLLELNGRRLYAALGGAFASFERSQWTVQGQGNLSVLSAPAGPAGPLRMEVAAAAAGSRHSGGFRTAVTRADARVYVLGPRAGAWVGGALQTGWTSSRDAIAHAVGPTAGAWLRGDAWHLTALATPYRLEGLWYPEVQVRALAWTGPLDVTAHAGRRGAPAGAGVPAVSWSGATVAWWVSPTVAFVIGGGRYPRDLLQALPGGRYFSGALRLATGRPRVPAPPDAGRALYAPAPGERELRFRVRDAARVDLVADWTAWQPIPLRRAPDGAWVTRVTLRRGVYRFNLIVDRTRWIVPDGVSAEEDGFGGRMALLVVQ